MLTELTLEKSSYVSLHVIDSLIESKHENKQDLFSK